MDQRRHKRYAPEEGMFAILRAGSKKEGHVVSVSKGGLAFEYVPPDEQVRQEGPPSVDLVLSQAHLDVLQIPCEVLYDFEAENKEFLKTCVEVRRCGLKFGNLSVEQAQGIDVFLADCIMRTN